ncbi:hypothetical protein AWB71_05274 [Caballeronia peredens]|nr:hypothetical protein AWB71_05274 [Caballeronia peredens]
MTKEEIIQELSAMPHYKILSYMTASFGTWKELILTNEEPRNFWECFHDSHAISLGYWGYLEHEEITDKIAEVLDEKMALPKKELVSYIMETLAG